MPKTFVISDTHFNSGNIIKYCNRPFIDADDQTEQLIANWNNLVAPDDTIIHMGDFIMGAADTIHDILPRLNGHIILCIGNHDTEAKLKIYRESYSSKIELHNVFYYSYCGIYFVCCHFPITSPDFLEMVRSDNSEVSMIHGHTHTRGDFFDEETHSFNVCVEKINYTPINIEVLYQKIREDFKEMGLARANATSLTDGFNYDEMFACKNTMSRGQN